MTLPPKVVRKQAELALPLIRQLEEAVISQGQPADQTLRRYYREHPEFGSRDRRFFSALVFSWFRWRGWLAPANAAHDAMACLLDVLEPHPTVTFLAEQNEINPQPAGALTLEEKARQAGRWLGTPPPSVESLVPGWVPAQLYVPADLEPIHHGRQCIQAFQRRPPTWIRAARAARERVAAMLTQQAIPACPHPRLAGAIRLQGAPDLERLAAGGSFEIQDLASQCVGWICAPGRGENWWDVCAGAGGKCLHLADLMEQQGAILATDVRAGRLDALRQRAHGRLRNMITCRTWDGTRASAPSQLFDGVLIDAPCSGIGTWARNPDARWRTAADDSARRQTVQQQLLLASADKVRPGGYLVYAVCTLTTAETQTAIAGFLDARPDFQLEPTLHPLSGRPTPGRIWIWPWEADSNGMFIARMKRAANPVFRPPR